MKQFDLVETALNVHAGDEPAPNAVPQRPLFGGRNPKTGEVELNPAWARPVRQMLVEAKTIEVTDGEKTALGAIPPAARGAEAKKLLGVIVALVGEGTVRWKAEPNSVLVIETDKQSVLVAAGLLPTALDALAHPDRFEKRDDRAATDLAANDPRALQAEADRLRTAAVENLFSDLPFLYETARWFWERSVSLENEAKLRFASQRKVQEAAKLLAAGKQQAAQASEMASKELAVQAEEVAAQRQATERRREVRQREMEDAKQLAARISALREEGKITEAAQVEAELLQLLRRNDPDWSRARDLRERIIEARFRGDHKLADQLESQRRDILQALAKRYPSEDSRPAASSAVPQYIRRLTTPQPHVNEDPRFAVPTTLPATHDSPTSQAHRLFPRRPTNRRRQRFPDAHLAR